MALVSLKSQDTGRQGLGEALRREAGSCLWMPFVQEDFDVEPIDKLSSDI